MHNNIHTIPLSAPFLETLAGGILARYGNDPLTLSRITVLLPNRRACRALREAFLRITEGKPLLLPAMRGIGDTDDEVMLADAAEIPPAISPVKRQMLLARMIQQWSAGQGREMGTSHAAQLAYELAAFLDEAQRYEVPLSKLARIVPENLAAHWQITLDFFAVLSQAWPEKLNALGLIDPITRRNMLLARQAERWRVQPPAYPVIAAGSTGSTPATGRLLEAIAGLEHGVIVLPGLDAVMAEGRWEKLEEQHPQFALKMLLKALGVGREEIVSFYPSSLEGRGDLLSELMRSPEDDAFWQDADIPETALAGFSRVEAATLQEEAGAIALMLRAQLETPHKTAALVTNDRDLAARVTVQLKRWDIAVDDSAGRALADTPPVVFLRLLAEMAASEFAPVPMLAALKHPLAKGGEEAAEFRSRVRNFEKAVLHGIRVGHGFDGFHAALRLHKMPDAEKEEITAWLRDLEKRVEDFARLFRKESADAQALLAAHIRAAEQLAPDLWNGEAGRQAAEWVVALQEATAQMTIAPRLYPHFFETLWLGQKFRPAYGSHPRIAILSPMEARLQRFDLMILGGINEGSWPDTRMNPWMNRSMQAEFGLPSAEFYTGLSARDFVECCSTPEVVLTRARKAYGKPTVPSPWWLRLDALLRAKGWEERLAPAEPWLAWAAALDVPAAVIPILPPAPMPPVEARPKRLSVTQVETWLRDPYAIYARHILGLKKLEDIDKDPDAAEYGTLLHGILEKYVKGFYEEGGAKDDQLSTLLEIGRKEFKKLAHLPAVEKLWWPRFERIAAWFVAHELERCASVKKAWLEMKGEAAFGDFTLSAKADRIELTGQGTIRIVDYKTGNIPTAASVEKGLAPQLTLTALMLERGGFADIGAAHAIEALEYWKLAPSGLEAKPVFELAEYNALLEDTEALFKELLESFARKETPYLACPDASTAPKYNDYEHLERIREWSITGGNDA